MRRLLLLAPLLLCCSGGNEPAAPQVLEATLPALSESDPDPVLEEPEPRMPEEEFTENAVELEEVADHNEVDVDSEFEESAGEDGLSDAPFEGPSTNSAIGLGGGAGGRRNLRAGGGAAAAGARGYGGGKGGPETHGAPPPETWRASRLVPHTTRIQVGDTEFLELSKLSAHVRVDGFRARVVLDLWFPNDKDRTLEGTFQLRLPDGATPWYLAFGDVVQQAALPAGKAEAWDDFEPAAVLARAAQGHSTPKVARVAPRTKAARAYRDTTRRQVDPALLEWAGAGVFQARVFPLLPGRMHRIVVAYDTDLQPGGDGLHYRLDLPEAIPHPDVALRVAGGAGEVAPRAVAEEGVYRWPATEARTFAVRVPAPGAVALRGHDGATGPYFAARFLPPLPAEAAPQRPRAVFLVDASLSAHPERFGVHLQLLRGILESNRDGLREFQVMFFNIERFWWRDGWTKNTAEAVDELARFAGGLALEGATDLAGALAALPDGDADVFLLSDGAATWGELALPAPGGAVFAYATGQGGTDRTALDRLARRTGGAVFHVGGPAEVEAACTAHRNRPWRVRGVAVEGGEDLLLRGNPETVFPGQAIVLAGRGRPATDAAVRLTLSRDGEERTFAVPLGETVESPLAPRVYGEIAVGGLEEAGAERAAVAYATHFAVPGESCSLLMLESEADYGRFDLKPEDTAFFVKAQPAAALVGRGADAPRGPKEELRAWLARLSGIGYEKSAALELLVERLPEGAFSVPCEALACRGRTWRDIPGPLSEALASHNVEYDGIVAEAARRRADLGAADALRALSSLLEERPGDAALSRDVAYAALEWDLPGHAYWLLRRVAEARPHEPQVFLSLAECLEAAGRADLAMLYYELALAAPTPTGDFRAIARRLYGRLLPRIDAAHLRGFAEARREGVPNEPADLVVLLQWNTDRTDIDLHVTDPDGEECMYSHRTTRQGGRMTSDVTDGFGPELFALSAAKAGEYLVRLHYYGQDRNRLSARTKARLTVVRGWGTAAEEVRRSTVLLRNERQLQEAARLVVERGKE